LAGWAYPSRSDADSCFVHRMLWDFDRADVRLR
jgi:hypothetical protein